MAESRDWAAVCIAPVIRRETSSPFQVVPVHKESPGRITASFEHMEKCIERSASHQKLYWSLREKHLA